MSMTILIAPSGFKESLDAKAVANAIAKGVRHVDGGIRIRIMPMADGGEGFAATMCEATSGVLHDCAVTGPLGEPVNATFGFLGGAGPRTAVMEIAAAAGLRLVPRTGRNPMLTTSFGVGELLRAALDRGCERVLVGCGDSGVNDGGIGMAQALGVRLLDSCGKPVGRGASELVRIRHIDVAQRDRRLEAVRIEAAVNWHNVLLGPKGVSRVFGPQKGATAEQIELLEAGLETLAMRVREDLGLSIGHGPGSGASGGLGAGLVAFAGATLRPRYDLILRYFDFDRMLKNVDLVITAEGGLDGQTPFGKVPCEVGRRAHARGVPVIALAGSIGKGATATLSNGIDAFSSIVNGPCSLEQAIASTETLLMHAAADAIRMVRIGQRLSNVAA